MNTMFSQAERQGQLTTVLGKDAMVLLRLDGTEELSGSFEWSVEALATKSDINLHALLGTHATVEVKHADGTRPFDGIICAAHALGGEENGWRYNLTLKPWLHIASLRRNMRIFHNKTVLEIVTEVLGSYSHLGKPHLDDRTSASYPVLEYTVQYGETDADFVFRQLERHGISWMWDHKLGNHAMVLVDAVDNLPEVPGGARPFYGVGEYHRHKEEHFNSWHAGDRMTTGEVRLTEYNFKTPLAAQEVARKGDATHANGTIESYDWPGDYLNQSEGKEVVGRRIEEERGQALRHHAEGDVVTLEAGARVKLVGDDVPGASKQTFVCLKAVHRFQAQAYGTGDTPSEDTPYTGTYVLMPDSAPFRPERRTIGPRVQGPETAVVVGEGEIDCDEHGRILCKFHWDDVSAHTMRVRVSQNWASKGWGGMVIPRIGMEVIVEHLRGDPDKPIVTGCVYNGANKPPYELPKHKTRSTFKTDTHNGTGFNELRFEDENGYEEIRIHAQRDMNTIVLNDETTSVQGNSRGIVYGNLTSEVLGGVQASFGKGVSINVGEKNFSSVLNGGRSLTGNRSSKMGNTFGRNIGSTMKPGALTVSTDKSASLNSGSDVGIRAKRTASIWAMGRVVLESVKGMTLTVGKIFRVDASDYAVIRAGKAIELRTGRSKLRMDQSGKIEISGVDIEINGTSIIKLKSNKIDMN